MIQYTILTVDDLVKHGGHSVPEYSGSGSSLRAELLNGLNDMAHNGFEVVSVGYDQNGMPQSFVLQSVTPD